MPTGYTADVQSGKVTDFKEFAMTCARAMGACIMMRDEPSGTPIPEAFAADTSYHDKSIDEQNARLNELNAMSIPALQEAAQQEYVAKLKAEAEYYTRKSTEKARYEAMLAHVRAWEPPTDEHVAFKTFMLQQLEESIRFDCSGDYWDTPVAMDALAWKQQEVEKAERYLSYHKKERENELERVAKRNAWLKAFRDSMEKL